MSKEDRPGQEGLGPEEQRNDNLQPFPEWLEEIGARQLLGAWLTAIHPTPLPFEAGHDPDLDYDLTKSLFRRRVRAELAHYNLSTREREFIFSQAYEDSAQPTEEEWNAIIQKMLTPPPPRQQTADGVFLLLWCTLERKILDKEEMLPEYGQLFATGLPLLLRQIQDLTQN